MTSHYLLGLIGHPVARSLSPPMHKAALAHCGLSGDYKLYDIPSEDFAAELSSLKAQGLAGFNVTIPHKMRILDYCAEVSPAVSRIGAANTICLRADGSFFADNTDVAGLASALRREFGARPDERGVACILGAGGAAKAALAVLSAEGYRKIFVLARDEAKAQVLRDDWQSNNGVDAQIIVVGFSDYATVSGAELFVSTIPYGQTVPLDTEFVSGLLLKSAGAECAVFDMVYSRDGKETALVEFSRQHGLPAADGTAMLVGQALQAFEIWTQQVVPFEVMHNALLAARKTLAFATFFVALALATQAAGLQALATGEDDIFTKYQRQSLDYEHAGDRVKALQTIDKARQELSSMPPYADKISQLRVRQAELQLQANQLSQALNAVRQLVADHGKIEANASVDGDLGLEFGYLKDLLLKYGQDHDSREALELADQVCSNFKIAHGKPRETLQPLCDFYIKHKLWVPLESAARRLQQLNETPLAQMSGLAMLQLSYEKQGKKREAAAANQKLLALDPKTPQNERVWHRDMATVQLSVRNYEQALKEIDQSLAADALLPGPSVQKTQTATDLGLKAEIESKLGRFQAAVNDARQADELWTKCNPDIWRSRDAITFSKCHGSTLSTLEGALRQLHKNKEADEIRSHRRSIEYVR